MGDPEYYDEDSDQYDADPDHYDEDPDQYDADPDHYDEDPDHYESDPNNYSGIMRIPIQQQNLGEYESCWEEHFVIWFYLSIYVGRTIMTFLQKSNIIFLSIWSLTTKNPGSVKMTLFHQDPDPGDAIHTYPTVLEVKSWLHLQLPEHLRTDLNPSSLKTKTKDI